MQILDTHVTNFFMALSFCIPILHSVLYFRDILNFKVYDAKMISISDVIRVAANAYLRKQYAYVSLVTILIAACMYCFFNTIVVIGFLIGSFLSGLCGVIGMQIAVVSNVRTAEKAKYDLGQAFGMSLQAGKATGLVIGGTAMACVAISMFMLSTHSIHYVTEMLLGLSLGASVVSIFARLGGGIFTKAADVGADLVGKIEKDIPEDDPRNPAVIADNVGDNVGDCAGTSADLFETYIVGFMSVFALICHNASSHDAMMLHLNNVAYIALSCTVGCHLALMTSRTMKKSPLYSLFMVLVKSALFSCLVYGAYFYIAKLHLNAEFCWLFISFLIGLICTFGLVFVTYYYTSSNCKPVKQIAKSSQFGHAMNIINGLSISMESCFFMIAMIVGLMILSYKIGNLIGIGVSIMSMLGMITTVIALDAYGPITDNAGGIAEMSGQDSSVRKITDELDALGNTTKALTKGYAVGSTALAAIIVIYMYMIDILQIAKLPLEIFRIDNVYFIAGSLIGGGLAYWYSALAMKAVASVGQVVVSEVRAQFQNNPGIMTGETKPDYSKTINVLTTKSINSMFAPIMVVFGTVVSFFLFCMFMGVDQSNVYHSAFIGISGLIIGVTIVGILLAISMTTGGGAWDNAKKYIEEGHYGGKGSDAHKAAVTGDTVGDPYKDTAGPALNPMIKMVNIVAILLIRMIFLGS